jgi:hypothetical protein
MQAYAVLAALLVLAGVAIGVAAPAFFSLGGWIGGGLILIFGLFLSLRRP